MMRSPSKSDMTDFNISSTSPPSSPPSYSPTGKQKQKEEVKEEVKERERVVSRGVRRDSMATDLSNSDSMFDPLECIIDHQLFVISMEWSSKMRTGTFVAKCFVPSRFTTIAPPLYYHYCY